jgi:peptidyl-prolyl cis-trans isomerase D
MISFLRRHRQTLIVSTFVIFLVGIFAGLGGYFFTDFDTTAAVAKVGDTKIPYLRFSVRVNQYIESLRSQGQEVSEAQVKQIKAEMLRDMIVNEILSQRAEAMGLHVSDLELSRTIEQTPAFQTDGKFDQNRYFQMITRGFKTTPEAYERDERRRLMAAKLKAVLFRSTKFVPAELRDEYVRAKGSIKNFEADRQAFAQELRQRRALDTINFFLRQLSTQTEIQTFLEQRERGL